MRGGPRKRGPRPKEGEPWRGETPGGHRGSGWFNYRADANGVPRGARPWRRVDVSSFPNGKGEPPTTAGGQRSPRGDTAPWEREALKGKAWTCQRDETSPQGNAGRKPSRGCENLRTEGASGVEPAEASEPAMRMARLGREPHGRSCLTYGQDGRLVPSYSGGGPKPQGG